ncbi:MAG TPA: DegT/DnrJ/EryC1/StrS family aminotransferase [Verrucomicrobiae bacterium]|nr:DegT/DnrJ/EryC1/StrS family aminotransferase [Verrucomicrobiae bacterium]
MGNFIYTKSRTIPYLLIFILVMYITKEMIPINKPWMGDDEKQEILDILEENMLTSPANKGGKRVQEFENILKSYLDIKHVILVNSGTSALHASLLAVGIKPGDEVILPSFTFVATANSVIAAGAKPIFADISMKDYTIDVEDIKRKINKNTKAIIPVHLYGHPSNMLEINSLAKENSLFVIEDACQSLGSTYLQKQTGTLGDIGCFSFYASKVITTGEGGAIATNNDEFAEKLRMIRNHGMIQGYDTTIFGLNLRLPELNAGIGKIQMKKLDKLLKIRRNNANILYDGLKKFESSDTILDLPNETNDKIYNWYLFTVRFKDIKTRELVKKQLISNEIGAVVYYDPPVHKTPYYQDLYPLPENALPNTISNWQRVLSLPVHPLVTENDLYRLIKIFENSIISKM